MKKVTLVAAIIGLCVGWYGLSAGAEWVEYGGSGGYTFFYDKESAVSGSADGTAKVWIKSVPKSDDERQKQVARLTEKLKQARVRNVDLSTLAYTVTFNEIGCGRREHRVLYAVYYDAQGAILYSSGAQKKEWELIIPDEYMEPLQKTFCPGPKRWWYFWR
jgi:hypothetical protein